MKREKQVAARIGEKNTPEVTVEEVIEERKIRLLEKFEEESGQGILPLTDDRFFEQANPIVRSALFSMVKRGGKISDWTEIFSFGQGNITYRGPTMTVDHEQVLARIMQLARGKSLTKPVCCTLADVLRWLNISDTGPNFSKARALLDDLAAGEIRISCKHALARLYRLLTSPAVVTLPDGKFFREYINNRYGAQIQMIGEALSADTKVDISMRFITNQTRDSRSGRLLINIDPIMAIFFDGVNTTMVPFDIWDDLDRFGKKLLPFIASHRDGVYPMLLESYHKFSGSKSDYLVVKRRFKSQMKKRFIEWEQKNYIEPGWELYVNSHGEEMVKGLRIGDTLRLKSKLTVLIGEKEVCVG